MTRRARSRLRAFGIFWLAALAASHVYLATRAAPALPPDATLVEVPRCDANGPLEGAAPVSIQVRAHGPADAPHVVVALHGSPGGGATFHRLATALGPEFRVLEPAMPGNGATTADVPDYGIRAQAWYALGILDALDVERAHVFGHSLGGGTAFYMAEFGPERVASITAYGSIGIMEGEGSGDYAFEQLKYRIGWGLCVALPELLPHFGALGPRQWRHAFIRNFLDTDQRPIRALLERLETPLLILHGVEDPLVPVWAARQHHELVPHSSLVVFEDSHFRVFSDAGSAGLAAECGPFVRAVAAGRPPERRTLDPHAGKERPTEALPSGVALERGMPAWAQIGAIVAGTFILEDPTSIGVGFLIRSGVLDAFLGLFAVILGVFLGDIGLYIFGRYPLRRMLARGLFKRWLRVERLEKLGAWFDRKGWQAIFASRFLPGTRIPVYVAAGLTARKPLRFALWTFLAAVVWTPLLVIGAALLGPELADRFAVVVGDSWVAWVLAGVTLLVLLRVGLLLCTRDGRLSLLAWCGRVRRWEFWPAWLLYLPMLPFFVHMRLTRGRFEDITAVNPVWPDGGMIGESKQEILDRFPSAWVEPSVRIAPGPEAAAAAAEHLGRVDWGWPVIVKPDAGQRGNGVRLVRDAAELERHMHATRVPVVLQRYHPGPEEAGLFWWRLPDNETGRLFAICHKVFPRVTGDGRTPLRALIARDRRLRLQHKVFFERFEHRLGEVLAEGEVLQLLHAGNHAQGCVFRDGEHLRTPALESALDTACRAAEGFDYGRLDVRYTDAEALRRGEFSIIEANGLSSEATNMYEPGASLWSALRLMREHWSAAMTIGKANRAAGRSTGMSWWNVLRAGRRWRREGRDARLAD